MNTALVLFIYNRLDNLRKIITKIRKVKPKIIFIFTDRPKIKKHTFVYLVLLMNIQIQK